MELIEHMLEKQSLDQYFSRKFEADLLDSTFFDHRKVSSESINRETFSLHMILGSILSFPFTNLYGSLNIDRTYLACDFKNFIVKVFFVQNNRNLIYRSFSFKTNVDESTKVSDTEFREIVGKLKASGLDTKNLIFENAKHYAITRPPEGYTYVVNKNTKLRNLNLLTNVHVKSSVTSPTIVDESLIEDLERWCEILNSDIHEQNTEKFRMITSKDLEITPIDTNFGSLDQFFGKIAQIYQFYDKNMFENKFSPSRVDHSAFVFGTLQLNFKEKYNLRLWQENDIFRHHDKAIIIVQSHLHNDPIMIDFKDQGSMNNVVKLAVENAVTYGIVLPEYMQIKAQKFTYAAVNLIATESVRIVKVPQQQRNFDNLITKIMDSVLPLYDDTFPNAPEILTDQILSAEESILKNIESIIPFRALRDITDYRFLSRYLLGEVGSKMSKYSVYTTKWKPQTYNIYDAGDKMITTFVFPTKFEKLNIHLNVYERDLPELDWNNFHNALDRLQPPRTSQNVEHIIRINIKINAKNNINDFEPLGNVELKEFFETQVNIEGDHFDHTKVGPLELQLIPSVKVPDFLTMAAVSELSMYEISIFFQAIKDRMEIESEFQAVLKGLFDRFLPIYDSINAFCDRSGSYHLILPLENDQNGKILLTFSMTSKETRSYKRLVFDEHGAFRRQTENVKKSFVILFDKDGRSARETMSALSYDTYLLIQKSKIERNRCTVSRRKRNELCELEHEALLKPLPEKFKYNRNIFQNIAEISKIAKISNEGLIAENLIADVINGEIKGLCLNLGFLTGGAMLNILAGKMTVWASKIQTLGKSTILNNALKISSPFVRRLTSGLILYDLINSIEEYKTDGDDIAKVNLIADSSFIILDTVEVGVEIAESLGAVAEISSITGPVGMALGAAILIGSDIYRSVKIINQIDATLHLSWSEKLKLGLMTFLHIDIEEKIQAINRKKLETKIAEEISKNLMLHENIFQYIGPTDLHNQVYLNNKIKSDKFHPFPYSPSREQLSCLPLSKSREIWNEQIFYHCENAIGMQKKKIDASKKVTLIDLGHGNDTAYGMTDSPNIFIIGNGHKFAKGGKDNDTFVLLGENVSGILDGDLGYNTLDLRHFQSSSLDTKVIIKFQHILGRENLEDRIVCSNELKQIDTGGGKSFNETDIILIENNHKFLKIVLRNHTKVENNADSGTFLYIIEDTSNLEINLTKNGPKHVFLLKDTKSFTASKKGLTFNLVNSSCYNCEFRLTEGLIISKNPHYIGTIKSKDRILNLMKKYQAIADELQIPITAFSTTDNATLMITYGVHDQQMNVVQNDPHYETHIVLNSGINLINLNFSHLTRIVLHKAKHSSNILDVRNFYNETVNIKIGQSSNNSWLITFYRKNPISRTFHGLGKVMLRNFTLEDLTRNFTMLGVVSMKITMDHHGEFAFRPEPLTFNANESKIILTENDVDYNQSIVLQQPVAKISIFKTETDDLIISDIVFRLRRYSAFAMIIIFKRFYKCQKMRTLTLEFENRRIFLNGTEFNDRNVYDFSVMNHTLFVGNDPL